MQRRYCNPCKSPPELPKGTPSTSINPQRLPAYPYPATATSSTSLTHSAPSNAAPRSVVPPCASPGTRMASMWNTTLDQHLLGVLPRRNAHPGRRRRRHTTTHNDPAPQHLGSRGPHGRHPPHQVPCGPAPPQGTRVRPPHTSYGWPSGACTPRTPYTSSNRSHTSTHTAMDAQTRRPNTRGPATPQGSNTYNWTPHTTVTCSTCPRYPRPHSPPNLYPRTRRTQIATRSTTTPHPSSSWPPHWATQRTPNSPDASKTPSTAPSTTPPCARIASQHTYKNPDSNSPSNSFPSSPDTTDGTRAARATSPQDTLNASVATRKRKLGTTSRCAPCTEDWTPSQTGTQPTPSHSTLDG